MESNLNTFAYFSYPVNTGELKELWPITRVIPDPWLKNALKAVSPFKTFRLKSVRSRQGKEVQGYFIACLQAAGYLDEKDTGLVSQKVLAAAGIAERLGARILGLGGLASLIRNNWQGLLKKIKIPVTTGNAFTAWSVFEAVYRMSRKKDIDLRKSALTVTGADTPLGALCSKKLSGYVRKIVLSGNNQDELRQLQQVIAESHPLEVIIEEDARAAVKDADVVVTGTGWQEDFPGMDALKPDIILCNVRLPGKVFGRLKSDRGIAAVDAGLVKVPFLNDFAIDKGLPKDVVYASLAEAMLLALEERFASYSLGENTNPDKLEEIADFAAQHGFEVWIPQAPLL